MGWWSALFSDRKGSAARTVPAITVLLLGLTTPILHGQPPVVESEPPPDSLLILDRNKDGVIDPYEALDALLAMEEELGEPITLAGVAKYLAEDRREDIVEATEMLEAMDTNGDGKTSLDELDENMREFAESLRRERRLVHHRGGVVRHRHRHRRSVDVSGGN